MQLWPFIPQRELRESLSWATDLLQAKSAEQSLSLRDEPRYTYRLDWVLSPEQYARAKLFIRSELPNTILLPLWNEFTEIGDVSSGVATVNFDTSYAHYKVGGSAVIWQDDKTFEVAEILSMTSGSLTFTENLVGSFVNAIIAPVKEALIQGTVDGGRASREEVEVSITFVSNDSEDLAAAGSYDTYRTHPVMTDRAVLLGTFTERQTQKLDDMDNQIGGIWRDEDQDYPQTVSLVTWDVETRADAWPIRTWLHQCKGKWKGFWVPSWSPDIVVTQDLTAAANTVRIQDIGWTTFATSGDIMLLTKDGSRYYLQILGAVTAGTGLEDLVVSGTIGFNLAVADIEAVYMLSFMRFDTDRFEFVHKVGSRTYLSAPVKEIPVP